MTSYVDTIRETIITHLDGSEKLVRDTMLIAPGLIRRGMRAAFDNAMGGLGRGVPDAGVDAVAAIVIESANDALIECLRHIEALREAAAFLGSPDNLRAMGDVFEAIGNEAQNLQISKGDLEGYLTWDAGERSKAYEAAIDGQVAALARVEPWMSGVRDVLRTHADDIENYYVQLLEVSVGVALAISGVVGAILGVVAAALSAVPTGGAGAVVGIIAAAVSLVVALGGVVVATIGAVQMILAATQGSNNKLVALKSEQPVEWVGQRFAQIQ